MPRVSAPTSAALTKAGNSGDRSDRQRADVAVRQLEVDQREPLGLARVEVLRRPVQAAADRLRQRLLAAPDLQRRRRRSRARPPSACARPPRRCGPGRSTSIPTSTPSVTAISARAPEWLRLKHSRGADELRLAVRAHREPHLLRDPAQRARRATIRSAARATVQRAGAPARLSRDARSRSSSESRTARHWTRASTCSRSTCQTSTVNTRGTEYALIQACRYDPQAHLGLRHVVERQREPQPRDLQRALEVADALVARLQQVEQLGRDLVPAAPLQHAELARVDQLARNRVEHQRRAQPLVGDVVAGRAADDPDRQPGATAELGQHDRHEQRIAFAALERAVDQQQLRPAVGARDQLARQAAERAQLRLGVALGGGAAAEVALAGRASSPASDDRLLDRRRARRRVQRTVVRTRDALGSKAPCF